MAAYYNDNDPFAAAWLRELIKAGLIAPGEVDERSIEEVKPDDLRGFTQCHFFAGIGVWSYALRLAGWPDERPVWTGSCPCPSFSAAGQGKGFEDPRHLWPRWLGIIRESRPTTIFGEQADKAIGFGWLDLVQTDLEAEGYAVGATVFGAHSVGAPHIRQRLYFVADSRGERIRTEECGSDDGPARAVKGEGDQWQRVRTDAGNGSGIFGQCSDANRRGSQERRTNSAITCGHIRNEDMRSASPELRLAGNGADSDGGNASTEGIQRGGEHGLRPEDSQPCDHGNTEIIGRRGRQNNEHSRRREHAPRQTSEAGNCLDSDCAGSFTREQASKGMGYGSAIEPTGSTFDGLDSGGAGLPQRECVRGFQQEAVESHARQVTERTSDALRDWRGPGWPDPVTARSVAEAGATRGYWSDCDWWYGRDGKYRPIGAGLFPLVAGATGRMGKLRGYGNAIVPQVAAAFIESFMEIRGMK